MRLEIDLALSIVHEYLASRNGEPPSETLSIVQSDDVLSYQTFETFLDDDSCDKLGIDDNLKTDSVQEIVNKRSESLEEHGFPQLSPLSKTSYDLELENVPEALNEQSGSLKQHRFPQPSPSSKKTDKSQELVADLIDLSSPAH